AFPIRFEESGDLLNLHHKWHPRRCHTAQEEIWRCSVEEVQQVAKIHPLLARHIGPPCHLRQTAGVTPLCPEPTRYGGVPVRKLLVDVMTRTRGARAMPVLLYRDTRGATHRYVVTRVRASIGRHGKSDLVLADSLVSRNHCLIEKRDGESWALVDLGS